MAAQKFLALVSGKIKEIFASVTSTANAIAAMDSSGKLDISMMPVGVGAETLVAPSFENLLAGDFVNIFLDTAVIKVRKADATTNAKQAHGFVLANVTSPANATVYFESNTNTSIVGVIGTDYYLSTTPGLITATPPSTAGNIVQFLGRAHSLTAMNFINGDPIEVA